MQASTKCPRRLEVDRNVAKIEELPREVKLALVYSLLRGKDHPGGDRRVEKTRARALRSRAHAILDPGLQHCVWLDIDAQSVVTRSCTHRDNTQTGGVGHTAYDALRPNGLSLGPRQQREVSDAKVLQRTTSAEA